MLLQYKVVLGTATSSGAVNNLHLMVAFLEILKWKQVHTAGGTSGTIAFSSGKSTGGKGGSITLSVGDGKTGIGGDVIINAGITSTSDSTGGAVTIGKW